MADCTASIKFYQWIGQTRFLSLPLKINDLSGPDPDLIGQLCWTLNICILSGFADKVADGGTKR